jgi:beta-barrel assembly-enhancing protease
MKRAIAFLTVLLIALSALYFSQRRRDSTPVSANAVLEIAADAQRDVTRVPMRLTRISDDQEIAMGNQLSSEYSAVPAKFTAEEQLRQDYVSRVGLIVATHAHRRLPYSFHLLPDRTMVNAFAIPGGHVFIGEGLLDVMSSEDQLAFVLAHEVEHIDHYHCAERVQIEARMRNLHLGLIGELLQIPISVWEAGYSKNEEMEADREGLHLEVLAGYSPYGAVSLFNKFNELNAEYVIHAKSPEQELSELAIQSLEGYFRSHPLTSERLAQAEQIIAQERWQERKAEKPFPAGFQAINDAPAANN